jgi:branched-chain amino acid transport system substrate-binding protein
MTISRLLAGSAVVAIAVAATSISATAQEREVKLSGFGAMSGVVRSFGVNSKAALEAAADEVNRAGGVKLGDGAKGKIVIDYFDDRCNAEEGISVTRRIASSPALVGIGPTCSNVAEPLFGILQKKFGDAGDSGLQFPIFTDVAIKGGLAKISEWAFRNVPDEGAMYRSLFQWIRKTRPELKSIFGGVEEDFAHSRATWYAVMKDVAAKEGLEVKGEAKWLLADTNFTNQAREARRAEADIIAISAHPFTTCGML